MLRIIALFIGLMGITACNSYHKELNLDTLLKRPLNNQPEIQNIVEEKTIIENGEMISDVVYIYLAVDSLGNVTKHFIDPNASTALLKHIDLNKLPKKVPEYIMCKNQENGSETCFPKESYLKLGYILLPKIELKEKSKFIKELPKLSYPHKLVKSKKETRLELQLIIDLFGKIEGMKIHKSSGIPELDKMVLERYKKTIRSEQYFQPYQHNGKPIIVQAILPIRFGLN